MKKNIKTDGSVKEIWGFNPETKLSRPLIGAHVPAGFPSPAQDYIEGSLDLNEFLIAHPSSTFFVRVDGYSMIDAGIFPDDILIVDRSLDAINNKIVIAILDSELTVKRLKIIGNKYWLYPDNPEYQPICIEEDIEFYIWGVVTYVIHKV
ncbi:MAG: peptidase S24 [Candidatus Cloacimonetes bacterium HGW-Cloacimonetes-1]|jgi:DNA polymerase V|nr:MAG: peptidase S24 [Candidatus Cloacimonetes bacterium HGW-Cloacimonetes-1]